MKKTFQVDIVSDVVCPWCIIGYKGLVQAIHEMGIADLVEIEWHPFEINPDMPPEGEERTAYSARKYGATPEDSARSRIQMTKLGTELGFSFDFFDGMKVVNTQDAHVLLEYAKEQGLQTQLKLRLFSAFFTERKDVSDRAVLAREVEAVGLKVNDALAQLDDDAARGRVQAQEAFWHQQGVSGVPTIIFNQSSVLTGAQPVEVYKQVFTQLIRNAEPLNE
ncbi:DsbA family oxidoreductase [Pontiellaceae bacterium B1224]|nr:DsbA family oxidoreductase [Pontiellaceae bacterium B1224]